MSESPQGLRLKFKSWPYRSHPNVLVLTKLLAFVYELVNKNCVLVRLIIVILFTKIGHEIKCTLTKKVIFTKKNPLLCWKFVKGVTPVLASNSILRFPFTKSDSSEREFGQGWICRKDLSSITKATKKWRMKSVLASYFQLLLHLGAKLFSLQK